jgi:ADP-heptose:LPS heptosyltransferase
VSLDELPPIGPFATPRPSMRGRYLIRQPLKAWGVAALDAALSLLPVRRTAAPARPARILVANWAHLGDVTTSIGALTALRARYPGARLGMIVGSWGRAAIADTGLVDELHVVDHWMLNRGPGSAAEKRARYRRTRAAAVRAMRALRYQVAIDLYAYFPPAHPLFRAAGVPVRIGFTSGGFGPLLTHPVRWTDEDRPMADQYRVLLDRIDPARPFPPAAMHPRLPAPGVVPDVVAGERVIVVHPGAGTPTRLWGTERWAAVIAGLGQRAPGHRIVLTGAGAQDVAITSALAAEAPGAVNMAGRASWAEFLAIVARADLVVCPDTAAAHVAALFEVPTVVVFTGTNKASQWGPDNPHARVLVRPVVCAPCNRYGCAAMACFRGVTPDDVLDAAAALLPPG